MFYLMRKFVIIEKLISGAYGHFIKHLSGPKEGYDSQNR